MPKSGEELPRLKGIWRMIVAVTLDLGSLAAAWYVLAPVPAGRGGRLVIRSRVTVWVMLPTTQSGAARSGFPYHSNHGTPRTTLLAPVQQYPIPRETEILNEKGGIPACRAALLPLISYTCGYIFFSHFARSSHMTII